METHTDTSDNGFTVQAGLPNETFRLRSYQTEMVEASLKENIIVAMDTGSGKTHIALARTEAALETSDPDQMVWFLAPTKALCHQQYNVFCSRLPGFGVRFLSGEDDVDRWTDQSIWDDVLKNVKIVISTHAVLLDALSHGFVKLNRVSLLIFDEAHSCTKDHPAHQIMQKFYLPLKFSSASDSIPRILGLSASPVINANPKGLETIEKNLDAITRTPKLHRSELIQFVHKPQFTIVSYSGLHSRKNSNPDSYQRLLKIVGALDSMQDPYIRRLVEQVEAGDSQARRRLEKTLMKHDTYCQKQLNNIAARLTHILNDLGSWATDWFLRECTSKFERLLDSSDPLLTPYSNTEKQYLHAVLEKALVESVPVLSPVGQYCTPKVQALVDTLVAESNPDFRGIVFAEQRATVAVLGQLLSEHTRTKDAFRIGTFVGTSISSKRKMNLADLAEPRLQQQVLEKFRDGDKNLIIATSVLEEGIDISSCHLVIDFDPPKNLKAFIQRRGRARKEKSKYIVLTPSFGSVQVASNPWESLEEKMKEAYMNDLREIKAAEERETIEEDSNLAFRIAATNALVDLHNASQHLHHFCAVLQSNSNIDMRPQFSFKNDEYDMVEAHITLPASVDASVRCSSSSRSWLTEKSAKRDACLQAYKALHAAGLINDNLLPLSQELGGTPQFNIPDNRPSLILVEPMLNPWSWVLSQPTNTSENTKPTESLSERRRSNANATTYYRTLVCLSSAGEQSARFIMITQSPLPQIPEVILYWNATKRYVILAQPLESALYQKKEIEFFKATTFRLLRSIFGSRMPAERRDFMALFVPVEDGSSPKATQLRHWLRMTEKDSPTVGALTFLSQHQGQEAGLIQVRGEDRLFILQEVLVENNGTEPRLTVSRFPKRRDFLHPENPGNQINEAYSYVLELEAKDCLVHRLPASLSIFVLFIPSLLNRYEVHMLAERLRTTILAPVSFDSTDLSIIVKAIMASSANEAEDYQRLEFLGDCILKLCTSVNLMASHLMWPEGYLTAEKGRTTSNGFLARATMQLGLERFIVTKGFTGSKWKPQYEADIISSQAEERVGKVERSSKLIADVIESLIGASYVVGGLPKALSCLCTLLPTEDWKPLEESQEVLFDAVPEEPSPRHLAVVDLITGYTFTKKHLMLEALTHPSFVGPAEVASSSYQRLEFLGDAVLDYIIVDRLYAHSPELSHETMHSIRSAMVNAAFLAFMSFENTIAKEQANIAIDLVTNERLPQEPSIVQRALWQYLRHSSPQTPQLQKAALERHMVSRDAILSALKEDRKYPWYLFARTEAEKFFSDVVESMIGAIYVDSHGDISACEGFIRNLGIMDCLERVLRDAVDCLHPKERLGHMAISDTVTYRRVDTGDKERYYCQVEVGGREIGGVVGGVKRLNAETEAAWWAVKILEEGEDTDMEGGVTVVESEGSESQFEDAKEAME
ncbi:P-loop containing nucleoside triphosphate hydrolase protein [Mytilinidion resinicola]|uniref:P-loop containing nucleoside triphosphate hydrolase protein n=1 Tax=Mytilinidion resinicola TaxID=574789 RepID=A0A6A6Y4V5_9PEZI|nr:P-loop containing nucleoside triphosphate hydrolase protein [Mytilinidion resinicola]KAF2803659.1 P-loop containing nucleoside triphosphate hydrolase protein [Mytilinidion resinicola]